MAARPLRELVAPDWAEALAPVEERIGELGEFLRAEIAAGRSYLPAGDNILRAFRQPLADVRVLIVGQDPYPTPGNPVGLSFSVAPDVRRLPGSLVNIFKEYETDLGYPRPSNGDLSPWSERGVMLLNRVLTVQPGAPGSHRGKGWEQVTEQAIRVAGGARRPAGRDPVGERRAQPGAAARQRAEHPVRAPEPDVGRSRVLRIPPVQPGGQAAARAGRRPARLETALAAVLPRQRPPGRKLGGPAGGTPVAFGRSCWPIEGHERGAG